MRLPTSPPAPAARGITFPEPRNDAERAAIAWACEMTSLEAAAEAMHDRSISWADFDVMLGDMSRDSAALPASSASAPIESGSEAIATGSLMTPLFEGAGV